MRQKLVQFGFAAAAAAAGFLLQHVLGGRGSRSSRGGTIDRVKEAATKPVQKLEDAAEDRSELLSDLGSRVSERVGRGQEAAADSADEATTELADLAERRREREERRRRRAGG